MITPKDSLTYVLPAIEPFRFLRHLSRVVAARTGAITDTHCGILCYRNGNFGGSCTNLDC